MCLTGVDYFSTLGYQPSIAFEAAGILAPLATVVLVLVTLFGALPVYAHVAAESPHGQGSIAMLERLLHGWRGKFLVLCLLGFAATDFIITKTLSAADAAKHMVANPYWPAQEPGTVFEEQELIVVTMILLVLLGGMFLRGFREVIGLAVGIVGVYLVLNAFVILSGLVYLLFHQDLLTTWWANVQNPDEWHLHDPLLRGSEWGIIIALCILYFPKLALGLSGFETGVAVMPLIEGKPDDDPHRPQGRINNTRKLLATAALIMSVYLLGSSLVVSTLIPPHDLLDVPGETVLAKAKDRALAYLAHGESPHYINPLFGEIFGTIYDASTVVILWFAGASAMAGLLNLVPQYLPRYGMAPEWARAVRPLVFLFTAINLLVTYIFRASVSAQGGAYATGVLVLMSSAATATVIDRWRKNRGRFILFRIPWFFGLIMLVFFYTTGAIVIEKPDGIKIAACFIFAILMASMISRARRSTEMRMIGFQYANEDSKFLWDSMKMLEFPVLVPHRPGQRDLIEKEESIRREHRLGPEVAIVFIEVQLGDASEFYQQPSLEVKQEEGRFIVKIDHCASISHCIAAGALELSRAGNPPEIHFGWSEESPLSTSFSFLLFGEGNVPWMVRELIRRAEPDPAKRPKVIVG